MPLIDPLPVDAIDDTKVRALVDDCERLLDLTTPDFDDCQLAL